jgi:hypothetical protein
VVKKTDPQFSTEDAAIPVASDKPAPAIPTMGALEDRPPSQNDPEGAPPVPPVEDPSALPPYPGNAAQGTFVMADGTIVRNC